MHSAELVGEHPSIQRLRVEISKAATSTLPVVIVGETGTGKELVVEALHAASGCSGALVPVNVAALPEQLAESELFGAMRGAYTSAYAARSGLIEAAADGTLFLDEACDLAPALQVKILRVLETGRVRQLGATVERQISFRLVLTLQHDPQLLVAARRWREDFLYRVAAVVLRVPPLRERLSDLPQLCAHLSARERLPLLDPAAVPELESHAWPGNVRELLRVLQRAALHAGGQPITPHHVRGALEGFRPIEPPAAVPVANAGPWRGRGSDERGQLLQALAVCTTVADAARALGITERTMYRRLNLHGIERRPGGGTSPPS